MFGTLHDCLAHEDRSVAVTTNEQEQMIVVEQHQNFLNGSWFWFIYHQSILFDPEEWDLLLTYEDVLHRLSADPDPDESRWTKTTREELEMMLDHQSAADELRDTLPDLSPEEALWLAEESAHHW